MVLLFILFGIGIIWLLVKHWTPERTIYIDQGKSSMVFKSKRHRIAAKPDRIVRGNRGYVEPHEFKSRKYGLTKRDVVQIETTAIALRDNGYKVKSAVLEVSSGKQYKIDIEPTEDILEGDTGMAILAVRAVKRGETPTAIPSVKNCRNCGFKSRCSYSY